jgi:hypothetical protein
MAEILNAATGITGPISQTGPLGPLFDPHSAGPAIVLSGGGAKGDFEVGAVRCLYNHGIMPNILCGTSVGSVNALKLAEGETTSSRTPAPPGHVRGLAGLERIWLNLNIDADMWAVEPGVTALFNTLSNLPAEFKTVQAQADAVGSASIGGVIASIFGAPGFLAFAPQLSDLNSLSDSATAILGQLTDALQDAANITGLVNYDPLENLMRTPASFDASLQEGSGIKLRLAMVALEDGALRYVNENSTLVERNGTVTPVPPRPTSAEIAQLKDQIAKLQEQIADMQPSGGKDSGGFQKPKPGIAGKIRQLQGLQTKLNWDSIRMDLIRAAIASSSLPVICRPTMMQDGRTYVDGGIRALAPVQAAVDAGASTVYVVAAGSTKFDSQTMDEITGSTPLPLLGIALRVGEAILPDEVGRRDLFPTNAYPVPVMVIQPDPNLDDLHDGLTLEPGLIRIRMAYGFMRSYDTLMAFQKHGKTFYLTNTALNSQRGHTMQIIQLRKQIWDLEYPANGKQFVLPTSSLPPAYYTIKNLPARDNNAHAQAKALKQQLAGLIQQRIAFYTDAANKIDGTASLPSDYATWSTQWEKHSWTPAVPL